MILDVEPAATSTKSRLRLVDDEQRATFARSRVKRLQILLRRKEHSACGQDWLDDDRSDTLRMLAEEFERRVEALTGASGMRKPDGTAAAIGRQKLVLPERRRFEIDLAGMVRDRTEIPRRERNPVIAAT